jgi:hypothetical protein
MHAQSPEGFDRPLQAIPGRYTSGHPRPPMFDQSLPAPCLELARHQKIEAQK